MFAMALYVLWLTMTSLSTGYNRHTEDIIRTDAFNSNLSRGLEKFSARESK